MISSIWLNAMPTDKQDSLPGALSNARKRSGSLQKSHSDNPAELTIRGMLIGAVITVVFMAANVYLGLKTGMTFSSSIPAAIISMSVLRVMGSAGILENNIVQTQASAAGTLCNVILVLPGLLLIGFWHDFRSGRQWRSALLAAS